MTRSGAILRPARTWIAATLGYHGAMTRALPTASFSILLMVAMLPAARAQPVPDTMARRTMACTGCHGEQGRATSDGYYPRIAGKPAGYLYNQLVNFREGRRTYPMMVYMVGNLSDDYLREMAEYFSGLHPPYPPPQPLQAPAAVLERGKPSSASCLPRDYLSGQFGAWKNGTRHAAKPDCMAELAGRLSVDDISAVSAWLSLQPAPANPLPQAAAAKALPLECGSTRQAQGAQR
jgi:cytochrome c553